MTTIKTPTKAHRVAYANQAQKAVALHWKLGEALRAHQQHHEASTGCTLGHVGDLQHVNAQLSELLHFLTGEH